MWARKRMARRLMHQMTTPLPEVSWRQIPHSDFYGPELDRLTEIETAARHLMDTMALVGRGGQLFTISDQHDNDSANLLRHAVLDLQAKLDGTAAPALAFPQETH